MDIIMTPVVPGVSLLSAEEHAAFYPIPTRREREGLLVGNQAKLIVHFDVGGENRIDRMWFQVTEVREGPTFVGELKNTPSRGEKRFAFGDLLTFGPEHVCDVVVLS